MAVRPIFIPSLHGNVFSITKDIDFIWAPGMAKIQKQKSIRALHTAANAQGITNLLEISSKSEDEKGIALSAFNLKSKQNYLPKNSL